MRRKDKYCDHCGCYIPEKWESCPACGSDGTRSAQQHDTFQTPNWYYSQMQMSTADMIQLQYLQQQASIAQQLAALRQTVQYVPAYPWTERDINGILRQTVQKDVFDKKASEGAGLTKQLRDKMTEDEAKKYIPYYPWEKRCGFQNNDVRQKTIDKLCQLELDIGVQ